MLGISKRELFTEYYPDELPALFQAYAQLHGAKPALQEAEPVDVMAFLSM